MPDWPHAPLHRFTESGIYFITAGTLHKHHLFTDATKLNTLQQLLFANAKEHDCSLQAWSLFVNHYHLVVSCSDGSRLHQMLSRLHTESAIELNRLDQAKGRRVWYQFRDTQLTYERSWLARLRYTHENAVHHKLVSRAANYPWCSASWFERKAPPVFVETVRRIKIDRVNVYDEY